MDLDQASERELVAPFLVSSLQLLGMDETSELSQLTTAQLSQEHVNRLVNTSLRVRSLLKERMGVFDLLQIELDTRLIPQTHHIRPDWIKTREIGDYTVRQLRVAIQ
jgi:hypothetical protein